MSNKNLNYITIGIFILATIVLCYYLFVHIPYKQEQERIEQVKKEEILKKEQTQECKKKVLEEMDKKWKHACEQQKIRNENDILECIKFELHYNYSQKSKKHIEETCRRRYVYELDEK